MFNFSNSQGGKGAGYIILNILRVVNILTLAMIAISSVLLMVVAKMPNGFTFFNDVALFFIVSVSVMLIISECELKWTRGYFEDNWPVIAPHRGFTWLGLAMVVMGSHTLGELSDNRNTPDSMTLPFWNLCLATGILSLVFGFTNMIASWVFATKGQSARSIRKDGAVSTTQEPIYDGYSGHSSHYAHNEKRETRSFNFFNNKEKSGSPIRPVISAPMPMDQDPEAGLDDRRSPIIPEISRPDSAMHPANRGNRYSLASNITRFTKRWQS